MNTWDEVGGPWSLTELQREGGGAISTHPHSSDYIFLTPTSNAILYLLLGGHVVQDIVQQLQCSV